MMRKTVIVSAALALLAGCGEKEKQAKESPAVAEQEAADAAGPAQQTAAQAVVKPGPPLASPQYAPHSVVPVDGEGGVRMNADAAQGNLGKAVFDKWCLPCHASLPGGAAQDKSATWRSTPGFAGTVALAERYKDTDIPAALHERTDLNDAFIRTFVRNGIYTMPQFRKTEITDAELDALSVYLSTAADASSAKPAQED